MEIRFKTNHEFIGYLPYLAGASWFVDQELGQIWPLEGDWKFVLESIDFITLREIITQTMCEVDTSL